MTLSEAKTRQNISLEVLQQDLLHLESNQGQWVTQNEMAMQMDKNFRN